MKNNPRSILTYSIWLLTLVVGVVSLPIFWYVMVDWQGIAAQLIPLSIACLFYYSFIRLNVIYCKPFFCSFQKKAPKKTFFSNAGFLFSQWSFWIESAVLVLVFILFPIEKIHPQIVEIYFDKFEVVNKVQILSVFLPVLLTINFLAYISVLKLWQTEAKWKKYESKKTMSSSFIYTLSIYAFAPILIVVLLPAFSYVSLAIQAIGLFMTPLTTVILIVLLVFGLTFAPLRAYSIRKKTVRLVNEACDQSGYRISEIKEPYRSVFKPCDGENFTIAKNGKTYSCKFIAAPKKRLPIVIYPEGQIHFLHELKIRGVRIMGYKTVKHFAYDSESSKILILNPVPKKLMAFRGRIVEIDIGDLVGDYKIYNTTAFVRAIENDTLER